LYRELVVKVFGHAPNKIYFYTEVEALAHTLITHSAEELGVDEKSRELVVLFMDFGDHNTVRTPFQGHC
jgi:hypothetical protein